MTIPNQNQIQYDNQNDQLIDNGTPVGSTNYGGIRGWYNSQSTLNKWLIGASVGLSGLLVTAALGAAAIFGIRNYYSHQNQSASPLVAAATMTYTPTMTATQTQMPPTSTLTSTSVPTLEETATLEYTPTSIPPTSTTVPTQAPTEQLQYAWLQFTAMGHTEKQGYSALELQNLYDTLENSKFNLVHGKKTDICFAAGDPDTGEIVSTAIDCGNQQNVYTLKIPTGADGKDIILMPVDKNGTALKNVYQANPLAAILLARDANPDNDIGMRVTRLDSGIYQVERVVPGIQDYENNISSLTGAHTNLHILSLTGLPTYDANNLNAFWKAFESLKAPESDRIQYFISTSPEGNGNYYLISGTMLNAILPDRRIFSVPTGRFGYTTFPKDVNRADLEKVLVYPDCRSVDWGIQTGGKTPNQFFNPTNPLSSVDIRKVLQNIGSQYFWNAAQEMSVSCGKSETIPPKDEPKSDLIIGGDDGPDGPTDPLDDGTGTDGDPINNGGVDN